VPKSRPKIVPCFGHFTLKAVGVLLQFRSKIAWQTRLLESFLVSILIVAPNGNRAQFPPLVADMLILPHHQGWQV
jgi:hypothetical protein